jgi:hypothetical protein
VAQPIGDHLAVIPVPVHHTVPTAGFIVDDGAGSLVFSGDTGPTEELWALARELGNVRAIVNLALLRGMVGRPHCGLLPIRGHSNVQGIGSVGVTPALKKAVLDRLESHFGIRPPATPGLDTLSCIEAAHRGDLSVGFCLGGNLFGSNPDAKLAQRAFAFPVALFPAMAEAYGSTESVGWLLSAMSIGAPRDWRALYRDGFTWCTSRSRPPRKTCGFC